MSGGIRCLWLLACMSSSCALHAPGRGLRVDLVMDTSAHVDGDPMYALATVRNAASAPLPIPPRPDACAGVTVVNSSGQDMTREQIWIDRIGTPATVLLRPDSSFYWVIPLHWHWGSSEEATPLTSYYGFRPGSYRVVLTFTDCGGYAASPLSGLAASAAFRVASPTPERAEVHRRLLASVTALVDRVKVVGYPDSALPQLRALIDDSTLVPYRAYLALEVASVLQVFSGHGYSASYARAVDSLRLSYLRTFMAPTPVALRTLQYIPPEKAAETDLGSLAPSLRPFVQQRSREPRGP